MVSAPPVERLGFPFQLVARYVIGALLSVFGILSLFWLIGRWAWLADQAIIDASMSPWLFFVPYAMMTATGIALLLRSRFVFAPFAIYCASFEWRTIKVYGWHQPSLAWLVFGVQLAMLSFLLSLAAKNRLR